jgi:hypothetical protein
LPVASSARDHREGNFLAGGIGQHQVRRERFQRRSQFLFGRDALRAQRDAAVAQHADDLLGVFGLLLGDDQLGDGFGQHGRPWAKISLSICCVLR